MKKQRVCFGCRRKMKKPALKGGDLCAACWEAEKMKSLYFEPIYLDRAALEKPAPPEVERAEAEIQKILDILFEDVEDPS